MNARRRSRPSTRITSQGRSHSLGGSITAESPPATAIMDWYTACRNSWSGNEVMRVSGRPSGVPLDLDPFEVGQLGATRGGGCPI